MAGPEIGCDVEGDTAVLTVESDAASDVLVPIIRRLADNAIAAGVARVEARIPESFRGTIRALHRSGFRREGRLRRAVAAPDGSRQDLLLYARLAEDRVDGQTGFTSVMDTVLPAKRMIGHVVFTDPAGRVLMVEPTYKPDWELPGGIIEHGEPPAVGAQRELMEELGFSVTLGAPALVDWMPPYLGWSDAVEFIWNAGVLPDSTHFLRPTGELRGIHWVALDELAQRVTPLSARRIPLVLTSTSTVFTVDGRVIS